MGQAAQTVADRHKILCSIEPLADNVTKPDPDRS